MTDSPSKYLAAFASTHELMLLQRRAADTLIRAIVGNPIETKNIHLQPKLVVRGSVKTIYGERILYV